MEPRTKKVEDIKIGDSVVEKDGYMLEVVDVYQGKRTVVLWCKSMMDTNLRSTEIRRGKLVRVA